MLSMLSRREFLAIGLVACSRSKEAPPKEAPLEWPRTSVHDGITFVELFPQGADESSPIIVAVHGRGDRPDRWVDTWRNFPAKARIALPRGLDPLGDGFTWFPSTHDTTDEQLGVTVGAAEEKLWRGITKLAAGRKVVVTGFSQGGILSFAMASRHPDAVVHAFPIAGACPSAFFPKEKGRTAPITAFHGTDDDVLEIRWAREAVKGFADQGNPAELREYPGVRHALPNRMREDAWAAMVSALPSSPAPDR